MKPLCVVSCPIDTFSGYGARSRDFVRALIKVRDKDWNIKILPQRWGDTPMKALPPDDPLFSRFIPQLPTQPDIWMQITVPNEFQPAGKSLNVGVTAGIETTVFPGDFIEGCNRMDLNLFSSTFSKETFLKTKLEKRDSNTQQVVANLEAQKPSEVVFEGLNTDVYYKNPKSTNILKDIKEEFCFLFTGHWLPGIFGEDRKNNGKLIETFLNTFKGSKKKKPALILKCNAVNYSLMDKEEILKKIIEIQEGVGGNLPNIYLLHGEMTNDELNQLNNDPKVKAFISFTKGEGFGRPLLEQAITGKPVIVSNWSGHVDFIHPDYNILIGGELKPVHPSAANQFLLKDSQWFNINTDIASRAMKDVFKNYKKYWESSRKQTQYLKDNWTFDKMAERLDEHLTQYTPKIAVQAQLNLPKVKKIELPKLKKIES
jgi:glycosyltransferase involved in cell wall biosynthesis